MEICVLILILLFITVSTIQNATPTPVDSTDVESRSLTESLSAAGADSNKYTCSCHRIPSDDGIKTLQCHCTHKIPGAPNIVEGGTPNPSGGLTIGTVRTTIPVPPAPDILSLVDPFCIRLIPLPLLITQPTFHVFTKTKEDQFKAVTYEGAKYYVQKLDENGYFAKGRQVIFVVHGFFGNACPTWMYDIKSKITDAEDSTVFVVNWQLGADNPGYGIAASTTQTVAGAVATVAEYIFQSSTFGGKKEGAYFYCVGHSLGAQICGQTGRRAKTADGHQLFDRVTALDPAGPGFERCSDGLHVSKDSAPCVDVIHSDGSLNGHLLLLVPHFGTMLQWGHIDFYPNGGSAQPSCVTGTNEVGCSHNAALDYFVSTISNPSVCEGIGPCWNGKDISGSCGDIRQNMGYWSTCHRTNLAKRVEGVFNVPISSTRNMKCTASPLMGCINTDGAFFTIKSSIVTNALVSGSSFAIPGLNTTQLLVELKSFPNLPNLPGFSSLPNLTSLAANLPSLPSLPSLPNLDASKWLPG